MRQYSSTKRIPVTGGAAIRQFAEHVVHLTEPASKLAYRSLPAHDPMQTQPNIGRAREHLNWKPRVQLEERLLKTIAYFDALLSSDKARKP